MGLLPSARSRHAANAVAISSEFLLQNQTLSDSTRRILGLLSVKSVLLTEHPAEAKAMSMTDHKILRTSLALAFSALTATTVAQTADPAWSQGSAASTSHSIVHPPTDNAAAPNAERSAISPSNVLEDVPRNMSGTPAPVTCNDDPAISGAPAKCRRWLEIARTL
jgi:hypothetical protein